MLKGGWGVGNEKETGNVIVLCLFSYFYVQVIRVK